MFIDLKRWSMGETDMMIRYGSYDLPPETALLSPPDGHKRHEARMGR